PAWRAPTGPSCCSRDLAVAVLVLLAAAARAGIVAADLGHVGLHARGHRLRLPGFLVGTQSTGTGVLELHLLLLALGLRALGRLHLRDLFLAADAHPRQQGDDVALELVQHLAEQFEALVLVLLLGLLLRIA